MKVFISWSGQLSNDVAVLLSEWLPLAVPGTETWLSKKDIEKGSIWFGDIEKALKETSVGIICLTRENRERPWLLFEAGGLNKSFADKSRVCPLLLDFDAKELESPLKDFNAAKPDKDDMLALCRMINRQNKVNPNTEDRLETFFDRFWTDFLNRFTALMAKHDRSQPSKPKPIQETLEKILETVEALLRHSQSRSLPPGFIPSGSSPYVVFAEPSSQMPAGGYKIVAMEHKLTPPNVGLSQADINKALAQALEWRKAITPEPSEPEQPSSKPPAF
jgi:hypothetical protein